MTRASFVLMDLFFYLFPHIRGLDPDLFKVHLVVIFKIKSVE